MSNPERAMSPCEEELINRITDLLVERDALADSLRKIEKRLFAFGHVQANLDRHDVSHMLDIVRDALAKTSGAR